jgi:hypothetical protein
MVCFQTKNPNLGKSWRALEWKMLVYFTVIWYILWSFGNVVVIWNIFPRFGILCQEKSGNPAMQRTNACDARCTFFLKKNLAAWTSFA